jgi:peptidoglycan/LPS O-acetylase OafA/YrhL
MESWRVRTLGLWALRGAVTPVTATTILTLPYVIIAKADLEQFLTFFNGLLFLTIMTVVPGALVGTLIGLGVLVSERALRTSAVSGAAVLIISTSVPILAFVIWVQQPLNNWRYPLVVSGIATAIAVAVAFRDLNRRPHG